MRYSLCITTEETLCDIPFAQLGGSFDSKIKRAAELGYDGLELMVTNPAKLDATKIANIIQEHGLAVSAISTGAIVTSRGISLIGPELVSSEEAQACLFGLIDFACKVQAPVVTIGSFRGKVSNILSIKAANNMLVEILKNVSDISFRNHVKIALEPINTTETGWLTNVEEVLGVIEDVGSDQIGILLDTYHMNVDRQPFQSTFQQANDCGKLLHVHIADSSRRIIGKGTINFSEVISNLYTLGYDGFLSAELLHGEDLDKTASEILKGIRRAEQGVPS